MRQLRAAPPLAARSMSSLSYIAPPTETLAHVALGFGSNRQPATGNENGQYCHISVACCLLPVACSTFSPVDSGEHHRDIVFARAIAEKLIGRGHHHIAHLDRIHVRGTLNGRPKP